MALEKTSFSVVWKGKTTLQIGEIIPRLSDFADNLDDFSDSSFEHLIIVHPPDDAPVSPGIQELTQFQVQFDQGQPNTEEETKKENSTEPQNEPQKSEEPISPLSSILTSVADNDSMINGSTGSCTSSMQPQCGSDVSDIPDVILAKRDNEIDDIISKDHIQMSRRDLNQLFDSFECDDSQSSPSIISPIIGDEIEKIFRFSAYDRLQPNVIANVKTPSETSSDDIVDIPITSNIVPEFECQLEKAISQHENFDISQDEISSASTRSDSTPENVTDDCLNGENAEGRSLLFEYENDQGEKTTEPTDHPSGHSTGQTDHSSGHPNQPEIDDEWLIKDDNPMAKLTINDPITDGLAPNAANVEIFSINSGDIRERGLDLGCRSNDEIRAEMSKSRSSLGSSNASRNPHGPSSHTDKGFTRDRTRADNNRDRENTKRNDDSWNDSPTSSINDGRTRDFRERGGYDSNRNHNRRSEGGLGGRDCFNRSSYSGKMNDNWNQDRRENRQNNRSSWNNNYSDNRNGGYSGNNHSYNMGTPGNNYRNSGRRNSYNSDGTNEYRANNSRNNNHRNNFNDEKHGRSGSTQHQGSWGNNNDYHSRVSASPEHRRMGMTSPRSNNRMDGTPTMNRKMTLSNRQFQGDHCNRDDFDGQTKQLNDESFALGGNCGGMRSDQPRNASYIDSW